MYSMHWDGWAQSLSHPSLKLHTFLLQLFYQAFCSLLRMFCSATGANKCMLLLVEIAPSGLLVHLSSGGTAVRVECQMNPVTISSCSYSSLVVLQLWNNWAVFTGSLPTSLSSLLILLLYYLYRLYFWLFSDCSLVSSPWIPWDLTFQSTEACRTLPKAFLKSIQEWPTALPSWSSVQKTQSNIWSTISHTQCNADYS